MDPFDIPPMIQIKQEKVDKVDKPTNNSGQGQSSSTTTSTSGTIPNSNPAILDLQTSSLSAYEKRILILTRNFPKGISDTVVKNDMPELGGLERATAINNLLELGLLELYKEKHGTDILYRLKTSAPEPEQMKYADSEEKVVFGLIKESGNKGIWIRDIRYKSNLTLTQLNKILKNLENNKLIKAVKSVAASKKKVYMLYELEADRSLTGGAWYSDQDFESEFVSILNQQCLRYLSDKQDKALEQLDTIGPKAVRLRSSTSLDDIWKYISKLGISKVELSMDDIESILHTLIYDGKIRSENRGDKKFYILVEPFVEAPGIVCVPCGVCPVFSNCSEVGAVNPPSCVYISQWLNPETVQTSTDLVPTTSSKSRQLSGSF